MSSVILWTPEDVADQKTLVVDQLGSMSLTGWSETDATTSRSVGGESTTTINDSYEQYTLEVRNIYQLAVSGSTYRWFALVSFLSHCQRGGRFAWATDSTRVVNTTIASVPPVEGDATFDVASATGITAGHWYRIERLHDPSTHELRRCKGIASVTVTLHSAVTSDYGVGARVVSEGYYPTCVMTPGGLDFAEQPAERGPYLWDLRLTFVTVI